MTSKTKKIGFTCGSFDLCHYGHILMLEEAKRQCDWLVVGVQTDPTIDRADKNKPIQSIEERIGQVRAIRYVDEVVIYSTEDELRTYLENRKPDVRFLGEDWIDKPFTGFMIEGIQHIFTSRKHSFSSSELRKRIAKAEKENGL